MKLILSCNIICHNKCKYHMLSTQTLQSFSYYLTLFFTHLSQRQILLNSHWFLLYSSSQILISGMHILYILQPNLNGQQSVLTSKLVKILFTLVEAFKVVGGKQKFCEWVMKHHSVRINYHFHILIPESENEHIISQKTHQEVFSMPFYYLLDQLFMGD